MLEVIHQKKKKMEKKVDSRWPETLGHLVIIGARGVTKKQNKLTIE